MDCQIQKMGPWKGTTLLENIHKELQVFLQRMSRNMKKTFCHVNVSGGALRDVTNAVGVTNYAVNASAA
jgi:hypothetical protein